jgi:hypothetical protein
MSLGPSHPVWTKLYTALASLASECGGTFAFVLDEGNGLWCVGLPHQAPTTFTAHENRAADRFYRDVIVPKMTSLRRGVHLDVAKVDGDDRHAALSFAGIYVVVVWFDAPFDPSLVRARLRRALPEVEKLTLALPPYDGPGTDEGAARARA